MDKIPLCRPFLGEEERQSVLEVLESGWLTHGSKNKKFEDNFAQYVGVKHAITMNSCTSALHIAVEILGIKGEVILPSFTWVASANAIVTAGARPVFADIKEDTLNIDPKAIENLITSRTEAIMPVHYGGQCADMTAMVNIAKKNGLALIEDSAETIGGKHNGQMAGSYGVGCFSFFPTKNMTTGEGGMLTTSDSDLDRKARILIGHGIDNTTYQRESSDKPWRREASQIGYNYRMSNILAAIGICQLDKLEEMNSRRRHLAAVYNNTLESIGDIIRPFESHDSVHVYQMYVIRVKDTKRRDGLVYFLRDRGIGASVHFDPPLHKMKPYEDYCNPCRALSVTEKICSEIVTLPIYPGMSVEQVGQICDSIKAYFK